MTAPYRPTNPFAEKPGQYRASNPFASTHRASNPFADATGGSSTGPDRRDAFARAVLGNEGLMSDAVVESPPDPRVHRELRGKPRLSERIPGTVGDIAEDVENFARGVPGGVVRGLTDVVRLPEQMIRAGVRAVKQAPDAHSPLDLLAGGVPEAPITEKLVGPIDAAIARVFEPEGLAGGAGMLTGMVATGVGASKALRQRGVTPQQFDEAVDASRALEPPSTRTKPLGDQPLTHEIPLEEAVPSTPKPTPAPPRAANEAGRVPLPVVTGTAGAGTGAAVGASQVEEDDSTAEKIAKVAGGAVLGAAGGAAIGKIPGRKGAAPPVVDEAQEAFDALLKPDEWIQIHPMPTKPGIASKPPRPTPPGITPREYFNVNRLDPSLPDHLKAQIEEVVVQRIAPERGIPKVRESFEQVRTRAARLLEIGEEKLQGLDPRRLNREEGVAALSLATQKFKQADALLTQAKKTGISAAERADLEGVAAATQSDAERLLATVAHGTTETARDLNAAKIIANLKTQPEYWYLRAKRVLGERPFLPEHRAQIDRFLASGRNDQMLNYLAGLHRSSVPKQIITMIRAGMLTNPVGRVRDLTSTMGNILTEFGPNAIGRNLADYLTARTITKGLRTSTLTTPKTVAEGAKGFADGLAEVSRMLGITAFRENKGNRLKAMVAQLRSADITPEMLSKYELPPHVNITMFGDNPVNTMGDVYTKTAYKLSATPDALLRSVAFRAYRTSLAKAQALSEGAKDVGARTTQLMEDMPLELEAEAMRLAEVAIFTNSGIAANLASKFVSLPGNIVKSTLGKVTTSRTAETTADAADALTRSQIPFARTPANLAVRVADYTPIGWSRMAYHFWNTIGKRALRGTSEEGILRYHQNTLSEVAGRNATGTLALMSLGAYLYKHGKASGASSASPTDRATKSGQGVTPSSFEWDGEWIPFSNLGPPGMAIAVGATLQEVAEKKAELQGIPEDDRTVSEEKRLANSGAQAVGAVTRTLLDQPMVTGTQSGLDMLRQPESYGATGAARIAGGVIPGWLRAVARATDKEDGVNVDRVPSGPVEGIKAALPGLRQQVPVRRKATGEPVPTRQGWQQLVNPFKGVDDARQSDPMWTEITRVRASIAPPTRFPGETAVDYDARVRYYGGEIRKEVEKLLQSPAYRTDPRTKRALSVPEQAEKIESKARTVKSRLTKLWSDAATQPR